MPSGNEQQRVVDEDARLTVVLGGAGTGKTTCASAAARRYLEDQARSHLDRVLFLSFSRASVSRITDRAHGVLGSFRDRIDITTFHSLAWNIVSRFGSIVGLPSPTLGSPAHHRIHAASTALHYNDLIPTALEILRRSPAVRSHLQSRWGLVLADEFQDTDNLQAELLDEISARARVILLGDSNQCIYTFRRGDGVRTERLAEACDDAGPQHTINLPEVSHRDPSGVIPATATAIMKREFNSPAIAEALRTGRLTVHTNVDAESETSTVGNIVRALKADGLGVAVFSHHNDMLATLSDGLQNDGIEHEIAGLEDASSAAVEAQVAMLRYAAGDFEWDSVLNALAVFAASAVRGTRIPALAVSLRDGSGDETLQEALASLEGRLAGSPIATARQEAAAAHAHLGLPTKRSAWNEASELLGPIVGRAARQVGRKATSATMAAQIGREAQDVVHDLLTGVARDDPARIQLMNLYQTKGREADATIVVLRDSDFFGRERHPFPDTSRLLYVVFSRARRNIVVVMVGSTLPPAVAPLARLRA